LSVAACAWRDANRTDDELTPLSAEEFDADMLKWAEQKASSIH